MEITNISLITFVNGFEVFDDLIGFDFVLELNRNHDLIVKEVEVLAKVIKPSKAYKEFQTKGEELYRKYSEKDDTGEAKTIPIGPDGQSKFVLDDATRTEFTAKYQVLRKEYKVAIDSFQANNKAYRESLGEKAKPVKLKKFSKGDLPKEINSGQMKLLFSVGMIK